MNPEQDDYRASKTLERLLPRVRAALGEATGSADWTAWEKRLAQEWPRLWSLLYRLYGTQYDFFYQLEMLLQAMARSWVERPAWLKRLDAERAEDPHWFESHRMVGAVCYVDLFAGDLPGVRQRIPYFRELGLTYLHLMPLFASPEGNSDGGYAVSSYRDVDRRLGTIDELRALAEDLRAAGISLVLDFVFNHTSDQHEWARRAIAGDPEYREFYYLFPDRTMPDAYERTLREIFPTVRRGSFTWRPDIQRWVWTTFNSFQWDLRYANPAVLVAMAEEMLFLANVGVEFLRLDAVAFIWKQLGTSCENLPEAHLIIQAFNAIARIAAPSLLFKSEAIVHPDDVVSYISPGECQISYNPLLMALLWEALATREVKLLSYSLAKRHALPAGTAWVNYLRSHDDIGWTFDDADARWVWIDPWGHRQFLNAFYTGRFPGSFARGVPFQENPETGDARVSGTLASLAGLELALEQGDAAAIDLAVRRILLLFSVVFAAGGTPLIYLGDELGTLNDYSYVSDPAKVDDSRWVHRPRFDERRLHGEVSGKIFTGLVGLIKLRKQQAAFDGNQLEAVHSGNPHVLCFVRHAGAQRILVAANFSEQSQLVDANTPRIYVPGTHFRDLVGKGQYDDTKPLTLDPYGYVWLVGME